MALASLLRLLPSQCCTGDVEAEIPEVLSQAVEFYQHDLPRTVMWRIPLLGEEVASTCPRSPQEV